MKKNKQLKNNISKGIIDKLFRKAIVSNMPLYPQGKLELPNNSKEDKEINSFYLFSFFFDMMYLNETEETILG